VPAGYTCACPAGFTGSYPTCTWTTKARTGATSGKKDICAPTIATLANNPDIHIYHQRIKFDSSTKTPQYYFLECQSDDTATNFVEHPTIMMVAGATPIKYIFDQTHPSNHYHPIGFAYKYDGAHVEVDSEANAELEDAKDSVTEYHYYKDGATLQGKKPDSASSGLGTTHANGLMDSDGSGNGLDAYEPQAFFSLDFYSAHTWHADLKISNSATGTLSTTDNTPTTAVNDFFYFCHIHGGMSGRIKTVKKGDEALESDADVTFLNSNADDTRADTNAATKPFFPATDVAYYGAAAAGLDATCGTNGLDAYKRGSGKCDDNFICDLPTAASTNAEKYATCLDAMDCYMEYHMRTTLNTDPTINFFEQMIPHHVNAVNMAKALLRLAPAKVTGDLEPIIYNIINVQSHQVQTMEGLLETAYAAANPVLTEKVACAKAAMSMNSAASNAVATAVSAVAAAAVSGAVAGFAGEL
jgi:uncharacterized protein (DUF305 family)